MTDQDQHQNRSWLFVGKLLQAIALGILLAYAVTQMIASGTGSSVFIYQGF